MILIPDFITECWSRGSPNTAHVHGLPLETLIQVFLFSIPEDPLNHKQPNTTIAPMLLCQVCSHWRRLALNTPFLWVHLYILSKIPLQWNFHTYEPKYYIGPVDFEFLEWWIGNSQSSPLIFRFEIKEEIHKITWWARNGTEQTQVDPVSLLFETISNARALYLDNFAYTGLQSQLYQHKLRYHPYRRTNLNLRFLAFLNNRNIPVLLVIPSLPSRAIALRHLICHHVGLEASVLRMAANNVPWPSLTHISIHTIFVSGPDWGSFIRNLDALQVGEFTVEITHEGHLTTEAYALKRLPHLRELRLDLKGFRFDPLSNLELPSLTTFRCDAPNMKPDFLHTLFLSSPRITTLQLGCSSPKNTFMTPTKELWSYAPRLEVLIIDVFYSPVSAKEHRRLEWLGLDYPPQNLRRLELVYITNRLSGIERYLSKFNAWHFLSKPGIDVVVSRESNVDHWKLSHSELRGWAEM